MRSFCCEQLKKENKIKRKTLLLKHIYNNVTEHIIKQRARAGKLIMRERVKSADDIGVKWQTSIE